MTRRFILVEDDAFTVDDIKYAVEDLGHEVVCFRTAREFYSQLPQMKSTDIFIIDLMLKKEGLSVPSEFQDAQTGQIIIHDIRKRLPSSVIALVTAWNFGGSDRYGTKNLVNFVFYKPIDVYDVIETILEQSGR